MLLDLIPVALVAQIGYAPLVMSISAIRGITVGRQDAVDQDVAIEFSPQMFPQPVKKQDQVALPELGLEFVIHIKEDPTRGQVKQIVAVHGQQPEIEQGGDLAIIINE